MKVSSVLFFGGEYSKLVSLCNFQSDDEIQQRVKRTMNPNGHKPSLLWKLNGHNIWKPFAWKVIKTRSICEFRKILSKYIFSISHLKSVIFSTFQFILAQMSITSFISTQISTTLMIIHRSDDILFQSCDALKIHPTVVTNLAFRISPHNLSSCFFPPFPLFFHCPFSIKRDGQ